MKKQYVISQLTHELHLLRVKNNEMLNELNTLKTNPDNRSPDHRPPDHRPPIHHPPIHHPPIHRPPIHRPPNHPYIVFTNRYMDMSCNPYVLEDTRNSDNTNMEYPHMIDVTTETMRDIQNEFVETKSPSTDTSDPKQSHKDQNRTFYSTPHDHFYYNPYGTYPYGNYPYGTYPYGNYPYGSYPYGYYPYDTYHYGYHHNDSYSHDHNGYDTD